MKTRAQHAASHAPDGDAQQKPITKIYHGTSELCLEGILNEGIIPRGKRDSNWQELPSRSDAVYLTTSNPLFHAIIPVFRAVVFEIDFSKLDKALLEPDEDFIADRIAHAQKVPVVDVNPKVKRSIRKYGKLWPESLAGIGCCAYRGKIPTTAITRYCVFDPRLRPGLAQAALTMPVTESNFALFGGMYEGLVQWMFGDRDDLQCLHTFDISGEIEKMPERKRTRWDYWMKESRDRNGIEVVTLHGNGEEVAA